jgi:hypothetical protein
MPSGSKLRSWIFEFGVENVATGLRSLNPRARVTRRTVERWVQGAHEPNGERIRELRRLSGGTLTADDVVDHFELMRALTRAR